MSEARPELIANATFLTFEPGLYDVEFRGTAVRLSEVGLSLPCARIEPLGSGAGCAFVTTTPAGGWLSPQTTAAHVLVVGGNVSAVLTIYRFADGTPIPEVHFRFVLAIPADPAPDSPATIPAAPAGMEDGWVGDMVGEQALEGFSIATPAGVSSAEFEYQGIMGHNWRTPWFEGGMFCGSRLTHLPLLGFRLRLRGTAAERLTCRAWGRFASVGIVGPLGSGEDCFAEGAPLLAMRVEIVPL